MAKSGKNFRDSARIPVRLKNWNGRKYWVVDLRGIGQGRKFFTSEEREAAFQHAAHVEKAFSGNGLAIRNPDLVEAVTAIQSHVKHPSDIEKALRFYYGRVPERTVSIQNALSEYFQWMEKNEWSYEYVRHERPRLRRFFQDFNDFQELYNSKFVQACDSVEGAPRTRKNYLAAVSTFLRWCVTRRYLSKKWDSWDLLTVRVKPKHKILIWTPTEMRTLLNYAGEKVLPYLLFGGFAGMRTSEIERLKWEHLSDKYVEVNAEISKISRRRLTPIQPNLKSWIEKIGKKSGRVIRKNPHTLLPKLCADAGIKWRKNALRDSFISYRLAVLQDAGKVAYEANNSPGTIYTNYRELVTEEQANKWFAIGNVKE